jgi:hypothetical protein
VTRFDRYCDRGVVLGLAAEDGCQVHPYGASTLALSVAGKYDGNITGARYVELGRTLGG